MRRSPTRTVPFSVWTMCFLRREVVPCPPPGRRPRTRRTKAMKRRGQSLPPGVAQMGVAGEQVVHHHAVVQAVDAVAALHAVGKLHRGVEVLQARVVELVAEAQHGLGAGVLPGNSPSSTRT